MSKVTKKECDKMIHYVNQCIASNYRCRQRLNKWDLIGKIFYWYGRICLKWERYDWEVLKRRISLRDKH